VPAPLPNLAPEVFASRLGELLVEQLPSQLELSAETFQGLYLHYEELRRWNVHLSLVGPGTAGEVLRRHYVESLAALALLPPAARAGGGGLGGGALRVVDIGSGGGFPGWPLAAALPGAEVTLVEAREKKWSFLLSATRRATLNCRCVNARVALPLPPGLPSKIDVVTLRALKLNPVILQTLAERLSPQGAFWLWLGEETPEIPSLLKPGRTVRLLGSDHRRILELTAEARTPPLTSGAREEAEP
jgi:16S rRNA (guanine527-N7)-methyltransferase